MEGFNNSSPAPAPSGRAAAIEEAAKKITQFVAAFEPVEIELNTDAWRRWAELRHELRAALALPADAEPKAQEPEPQPPGDTERELQRLRNKESKLSRQKASLREVVLSMTDKNAALKNKIRRLNSYIAKHYIAKLKEAQDDQHPPPSDAEVEAWREEAVATRLPERNWFAIYISQINEAIALMRRANGRDRSGTVKP